MGEARRKLWIAAALTLAAVATAPAAASAGQVRAGVAVLDGTYHVGNSAGQYSSTKDGGYGDVDPHVQQVKNKASYGVQARESVRALVVEGADGNLIAMVSDDHYIPQDALLRRTAQLLEQQTGGRIGMKNLMMSVTHNHSSPSYSSIDWGVWAFQDVFDFRFFDYYARQNAKAVMQALSNMHDVRVSGTVSYFDAFHKNPMGPGQGDDGTPTGFPRSYTDHDLVVVHFENIDDPDNPKPLSTIVNIGQHPEFLEGYDLITSEYPGVAERIVDRTVGGVSIFTQNATGTSEVEEDRWHDIHDRAIFNHTQYTQMEWAGRLLADGVIENVTDIRTQTPNSDDNPTPYGGTSYHDRFVSWMTDFPVGVEDRWFGGPVSHPYPGVSSCRTDSALQRDPRIPVVGLPDCTSIYDLECDYGACVAESTISPIYNQACATCPSVTTDDFEELGIPIPENYSAPSYGALEDTLGVHMQAFRLGDILFTVCSCEQWADQAYNIKTRTDTQPGNEYLGYDPTSPDADPALKCVDDPGSDWTCTFRDDPGGPYTRSVPDNLMEHARAQIRNDASGWDDPTCRELGCGFMAESEPTDLSKIRGNYTHDDTADKPDSKAADHGYKLVATISMANDYNGYIATYRDFMSHDHYRKALTGWGPHSSDYYATRLTQMGHALKGDEGAKAKLDGQTDITKVDPAWAAIVAKEVADQAVEEARVRAVGEAASAGVVAYDATVPDDGAGSADDVKQPKDIKRFDATTFTWVGGNNYTDNPEVKVQRKVGDDWVDFADQSGEVPITVAYPGGEANFDEAGFQQAADGVVGYRAGGQVWKWTATFEAFVSWMPLVDPQGKTYRATPAGTYRFVVDGLWHQGGAVAPYSRTSEEFEVAVWDGITVVDPTVGGEGRLRFAAGPTTDLTENKVRDGSARPNFGALPFSIGPVNYPDTAQDQAATGARFLNAIRGYSGDSPTNVEHYCLDCTFRPWLDATGALTAHVKILRAGGEVAMETIAADSAGRFASDATLEPGDVATVTVEDEWGNRTASPAVISG